MAGSLLISGGAVVTVDDSRRVIEPGWVHVTDDVIASIGEGTPPDELIDAVDETIDASGMAVMPGMVNAHTHLFQTFFRGLADDKPLLDWLHACIWPGATHLDADAGYLAAKIGLIENLLSGATSVIDHQYVNVDPRTSAAVCRAADELGIRFVLGRGWADRNYHPPLTETAGAILERATELFDEWDGAGAGRIRVELAPLIPWGCSDETMRATTKRARSWGRGTHIHCAETSIEVDMSLEERGVRHVNWLRDLGVLGPDVQLVHSVWLDDEEIAIIAETGSVVVHCPVSNMYLASGVARVPDMRAAGIPVALATDGPGSNNRQDMFEALKISVLLQKVHHLDAMILQPEDALDMACRGGAAAMTMIAEIGSIECGRKADLVVVDLQSPFVAPVNRVVSSLVFNATPRDVRHVVVDGRIVVRNGTVPGVDIGELIREAERAAAAMFRAAGVDTRLTRGC